MSLIFFHDRLYDILLKWPDSVLTIRHLCVCVCVCVSVPVGSVYLYACLPTETTASRPAEWAETQQVATRKTWHTGALLVYRPNTIPRGIEPVT